ncbi:MAG: hypothetical protein CMP61_08680 [Flavobacteriales bacterium]|nr:hypothetical protein [Flavobacteriales bacterium]|tara:strand:- start:17987 stop:18880 length:894 start_codon:yes stop_codon:yes gene_type:complete
MTYKEFLNSEVQLDCLNLQILFDQISKFENDIALTFSKYFSSYELREILVELNYSTPIDVPATFKPKEIKVYETSMSSDKTPKYLLKVLDNSGTESYLRNYLSQYKNIPIVIVFNEVEFKEDLIGLYPSKKNGNKLINWYNLIDVVLYSITRHGSSEKRVAQLFLFDRDSRAKYPNVHLENKLKKVCEGKHLVTKINQDCHFFKIDNGVLISQRLFDLIKDIFSVKLTWNSLESIAIDGDLYSFYHLPFGTYLEEDNYRLLFDEVAMFMSGEVRKRMVCSGLFFNANSLKLGHFKPR